MTVACRSCGRPVWWATTTHGKRMPVDAAPAPDGNLIIVDAHGQVVAPSAAFALLDRVPRVEVEVARRGPRTIDPDVPRWRSHFSTCPNAQRHRKARP